MFDEKMSCISLFLPDMNHLDDEEISTFNKHERNTAFSDFLRFLKHMKISDQFPDSTSVES